MARPPQDSKIRINEILNAADQLFFTQGYHVTKDGLLLSMLYDVQNLHIKDKLFYKLEVELSPWMLTMVNEGIATHQFCVAHPPTVVEYTLAIVEVLSIALHRKLSPEVLAFRLEMAEILLEKMMGAQEKTIHIQLPEQVNK